MMEYERIVAEKDQAIPFRAHSKTMKEVFKGVFAFAGVQPFFVQIRESSRKAVKEMNVGKVINNNLV